MDATDAGLQTAQGIATAFAELEQVTAVVLGGSRATGAADPSSDLDLYVYAMTEVPVAFRSDLAARRSARCEIDNRVWETGDEWDERRSGLHVDVMYRAPAWAEDELGRLLDRHEARLGYSTCIWHNIATARPLFDRQGWFARLQDRAHQPYPEPLAHAIVAANQPVLRTLFGSYRGQIMKAAARDDAISINHRVAAFLASYFDVLFAVNRTMHPGEKRLLQAAKALPQVPSCLDVELERLLSSSVAFDLASAIDAMCDGLDLLLPAPSSSES